MDLHHSGLRRQPRVCEAPEPAIAAAKVTARLMGCSYGEKGASPGGPGKPWEIHTTVENSLTAALEGDRIHV
ncbi:MAG TPA: hypothetical protein G4O12_08565 [Dehalococcoidia bacterium]|nr:hypothetical protein [Dehalococcoidia bacterium]